MSSLMTWPRQWFVAVLLFAPSIVAADMPQLDLSRLERIQNALSADVPRVLCLDESFATGGQPTAKAYQKAAAFGFRTVLSLRTNDEGVDLVRERARVASAKMRYFNIPVRSSDPRSEQANEFRRIARDQTNHPMLINCASANRVGAFMMILRVVEHGWSEDKALAEALKIGLASDTLKQFAKRYIAQQKALRD